MGDAGTTNVINPSLITPEAIYHFVTDIHSPHHGTTSLNAKEVCSRFFTNDIIIYFANEPPINGIEAAEAFFTFQYALLSKTTHEVTIADFIPGQNKIYQPAKVGYLVKGDDEATQMMYCMAVAIFWVREEQGKLMIWKAEVLIDASKVMARMAEKGLLQQ